MIYGELKSVRCDERGVRCDERGIPKEIQYIEYDYNGHLFKIALFDGQEMALCASKFNVGLTQRVSDEHYQDVEDYVKQLMRNEVILTRNRIMVDLEKFIMFDGKIFQVVSIVGGEAKVEDRQGGRIILRKDQLVYLQDILKAFESLPEVDERDEMMGCLYVSELTSTVYRVIGKGTYDSDVTVLSYNAHNDDDVAVIPIKSLIPLEDLE